MTMDTEYKIIEIDELKNKNKENHYSLIVFGTWEYGRRVCAALEGFDLPVLYYCDNDSDRWGNIIDHKKILSPAEITDVENPLVVIGSFAYVNISNQLKQLGVNEVYALLECPVNTRQEMEEDRQCMDEYFVNYDENISNRILVEVYGHFGDVIVKTGVCKLFINEYGRDNVYFLVDDTEKRNIGAYLALFSPNIITVEMKRFRDDCAYRRRLLMQLNSMYFRFSYNLCFMGFHLKMRFLNKFNLNIKKIYVRPEEHYVLDKDYIMLKEIFGRDVRKECEERNQITEELQLLSVPEEVPDKFVAIHMGAARTLRMYPVEKFRKVFEYLLSKKYNLVFLGYGEKETAFLQELLGKRMYDVHIVNLISKLTMLESMKIVSKCTFFVGLESGLFNAAYLLHKKGVVIYGMGDYGHYIHKDSKMHYVMWRKERCEKCVFWDCTNDMTIDGMSPCVAEISAEDIIEAIGEVEKEV